MQKVEEGDRGIDAERAIKRQRDTVYTIRGIR